MTTLIIFYKIYLKTELSLKIKSAVKYDKNYIIQNNWNTSVRKEEIFVSRNTLENSGELEGNWLNLDQIENKEKEVQSTGSLTTVRGLTLQ